MEKDSDYKQLRLELDAAKELIKRRLEQRLGDCQVYWEYDAKEFLEKGKIPT